MDIILDVDHDRQSTQRLARQVRRRSALARITRGVILVAPLAAAITVQLIALTPISSAHAIIPHLVAPQHHVSPYGPCPGNNSPC